MNCAPDWSILISSIFATIKETNWSSWILGISSIITTFAVFRTFQIQKIQANTQKNQFNLEKSLSEEKTPAVYIWFNSHQIPEIKNKREGKGFIFGTFTIINVGGSTLSVRTIKILKISEQNLTPVPFFLNSISDGKLNEKFSNSDEGSEELNDILFIPNHIYSIAVCDRFFQAKISVTYYDGTNKLIDIDTAISKGPYIITGKGKNT